MSAPPRALLQQLADDLPSVNLQATADPSQDTGPSQSPGRDEQASRAHTTEIFSILSAPVGNPDEPLIARVCGTQYGNAHLEWCSESELSLDHTHGVHSVIPTTIDTIFDDLDITSDDVLCNATIPCLFTLYSCWRPMDLRKLARIHNVAHTDRDNRLALHDKLLTHDCDERCAPYVVIFTTLSRVRSLRESSIHSRVTERTPSSHSESSYLEIAGDTLRQSIIREWQDTLSMANLEQSVCAPCGRQFPRRDLSSIHPDLFDLKLLRNDALPPITRPTTYAFALYDRALLHVKGLSNLWNIAPMNMCTACRRDLVDKRQMPRLSLANWLYYAHDSLPAAVSKAFANSSQFDKMLIARARSSRISFRFTELRAADTSNTEPIDAHESRVSAQRFVRGNVLIMPQNSTLLNAVLPPPASVIRDTVCAVFVGNQKPTRKTIGGLGPVLVRRTTVETIIKFLVERNPHYAPDDESFFGFSPDNLNALFADDEATADLGVPCAMEVGFIRDNDAIRAATSDYTNRNELEDVPPANEPILMENVGYTCGDRSPVSYRDMKLSALAHCLNGGTFIRSQAGDTFVPDFHNPALLSWLFPHLDPWGIGGFHHPHRTLPITMEEQLKYLLQLADGPFQKDPDFAFVYFNILQKKAVCDSVHFRVKQSQQRRIVDKLLQVDRDVLRTLIAKFDTNKHYEPDTTEEVQLLTLINNVGAVLHDIPGTTGYKLNMRNEIRALVNFHGTPAFFVTLNPADVHHPLVRLYAGDHISLEDAAVGEELTEWRRRLLVARNPGACAMFFHTMIANFLSIILRYGRPEPGLLGSCAAYYGTVEAQARGTLHCHLLIWIKDHPSPQKMRDLMIADADYQQRLFAWLESLIKCEPLGVSRVVGTATSVPRERPQHSTSQGRIHPGVNRPPRIATMLPADFKLQYHTFVNELVDQFNWHEHKETCWKYLRRNQQRVDGNCRMRIDGTTRAVTAVDPDTLSIMLRRLHPWIASYNDLVIFLMQANMDIKHIGSGEGAKALIFYITDYITKASIPTHLGLAALLYAIDRTSSKYGQSRPWNAQNDAGALTILINSMLSRQEISHQQVMSYLVGGGDHYTSHRFRLLHYHTFEQLILQYWGSPQTLPVPLDHSLEIPSAIADTTAGPLTQASDSENLDSGPADDIADNDPLDPVVTLTLTPGTISATNQQQDYLLRPLNEPFASMPLYQYVGLTEKITCDAESRRLQNRSQPTTNNRRPGRPEQDRGTFLVNHPHHTSHLVRKRIAWVVPVILNRNLPRPDGSPEDRELWARTVLTLFVPWRSPSDLKSVGETWSDAYNRILPSIAPQHRTIIHNMSVLSECKDARDKATAAARADALSNPTPTTTDRSEVVPPELLTHFPADSLSVLPDYPAGVELDIPQPPTIRSSTAATLDQLISAQARVGFDNCFREAGLSTQHLPLGTAALVEELDEPTIATQQTTMRKLKRKRRPSPPPAPLHLPQPFIPNLPPRVPTVTTERLPDNHTTSPLQNQTTPSFPNRPASLDLSGVIQQVIVEYNLHDSPDQLRAFELVAWHVCYGGPQLLMYIAGVGGTGKSYVVSAIIRLFVLLGRREQILLSAPTGAAALLIGGYTVHSLLLLPEREGVDLQPLVPLWAGVHYLIIDEVSMVSAQLLSSISMRLQHAKGVSALAEDVPFGGVNIIFLGDFGQLRPVAGGALYSQRRTKNLTAKDGQSKKVVNTLKGLYLWQDLVKTVVILRKNHRQSTDPAYSDLLSRVREGECGIARRANTTDDYATLQTRLLQNFDPETAARFRDAPVLVGIKSVRDPLNERILQHYARNMRETVHYYHSRDELPRRTLDSRLRQTLWDLPSSITKDALGRLPLFPGMKVMIQENVAFACSVVNGAVGTVRDIKYTEEDGNRYVSVVYVEIPGAGRFFGPDHNDIIPIFPLPAKFVWTVVPATSTTRALEITVTRTQPPLLPAYVYTDYKGQGRTLDTAIIDPDSALTLQGIYVMLSRVKTLDGVALLRPFRAAKIENNISQQLRDVFQRIEEDNEITLKAYNVDPRRYM